MIKPDKEVTTVEEEVHNIKIPLVEKILERFNNKKSKNS